MRNEMRVRIGCGLTYDHAMTECRAITTICNVQKKRTVNIMFVRKLKCDRDAKLKFACKR